jgi:SAM-dependent methyltransferase
MSNVIWHDIECGSYTLDLLLWRELAETYGDPILDIGAGTGRVAIDLASQGHQVCALDADAELIEELIRRAGGSSIETVVADARDFDLSRHFALCIVPMQTIQLLGGAAGRERFLRCAKRHLAAPGGVLAAAISPILDLYETDDGLPSPLPDIRELDGVVYSSQPTAVRAEQDGFVLERRRDVVAPNGETTSSDDAVRLDRLTAEQLISEGARVGLIPAGNRSVPASRDYVGSDVVLLRA